VSFVLLKSKNEAVKMLNSNFKRSGIHHTYWMKYICSIAVWLICLVLCFYLEHLWIELFVFYVLALVQ